MKSISCIVVEDEPYGQEIIRAYIEQVPNLLLKGIFGKAADALTFLQNNHIELLFLDVHLPDLSGISLLKSFTKPPMVIFSTAYPNYAVDGFDLNALDYLLKPYSFERFLKAVNKAFDNQEEKALASEEKVILSSGKKIYPLFANQIVYFEGCGDYVTVKMSDSQLIIHTTMNELAMSLNPSTFLRIHRSYIVNVHKIECVGNKSISINGQSFAVGAKYADTVEQLYKTSKS